MSQAAALRGGPRAGDRSSGGLPVRRTVPLRRLRVVAPASSTSRVGLAVLCVVLLSVGLLALLLLNISLSRGVFELSAVQGEQRALAETRQQLQEEVEGARAPQRLAQRARALGMVPAPNAAFVRLSDGQVLGSPEVARGLPQPLPPKRPTRQSTAGRAAGSTPAAPTRPADRGAPAARKKASPEAAPSVDADQGKPASSDPDRP